MSACPQRNLLVSFERGQLDDTETAQLEEHVTRCSKCQSLMERIRQADRGAGLVRNVLRGFYDDAIPPGTTIITPAQEHGENDPTQSGRTVITGESTGYAALSTGPGEWVIPDYERIVLCGEGSYGSVWAVRDRVGVHRALKTIELQRMSQLGIGCREQSALEAYCRKVTRHPHLITIYHVGIIGKLLYYTMDLADDRTRGAVRDEFPEHYRPYTLHLLLRRRRLRIEIAIEIARRLLEGLVHLHNAGLVHRDVKPSNVVFVDRQPKLADIGILAANSDDGEVLGTPKYMPPDRMMDQTADTYAMGKMLHEMLCGAAHDAFPELPPDRRWHDNGWDQARVSRLIIRACAKKASDRYQTAAHMLEDLEQCVELSYDSLFDELEELPSPPDNFAAREAIQLAYNLLRTLPWIFGILALLLVMRFLTG